MSPSMSAQAPVMNLAAVVEEARGPTRLVRGRSEARDQPSPFGLACRDVIDEVRLRMARRGYQWD